MDRQGALVRTKGDRLVVTDGDESLLRLGLRRVRQVVCFGRVGLTTAFLHRAVDRGIEVVLLTEQGSLGGRLTAPTVSDPQVRRAQYRAADNDADPRRLATAMVSGKVGNLRVALLRAARREDDEEAAFAADLIAEMSADLDSRPSLDAIRGVEGTASREYFQALGRMLDPEWGFHGRQRRPPPDLAPNGTSMGVQDCDLAPNGCSAPHSDRESAPDGGEREVVVGDVQGAVFRGTPPGVTSATHSVILTWPWAHEPGSPRPVRARAGRGQRLVHTRATSTRCRSCG